jgi:hypothetical protein
MSADSTKSVMGHVKTNLCFCIQWDFGSRSAFAFCLGRETLTHYFSCLGGTGTDSKKSAPTHYAKLVFYIR